IQLLSGDARPAGVFAPSRRLALAVTDTARPRFGLPVPDDLRVIGFAAIPAAAYDGYALTTFRQDTQGLANAAVGMLAERMQAFSGPSRTQVVPVTRVIRHSCG
ncbi:substrate-binding domain-containing protein, partial [Paraburkholderia sp. Se-20369]|nr:substrate-binding domain-containing protein [Paraburkholderia sp. Se-20369]